MKLFPRLAAPLLALAGLVLAVPAPAQQHVPTPQPVEAVPAPEVARPALWKVADADTTIYLFGTIHLLPKGVEWYDGAVANSFEQSGEQVRVIHSFCGQRSIRVGSLSPPHIGGYFPRK